MSMVFIHSMLSGSGPSPFAQALLSARLRSRAPRFTKSSRERLPMRSSAAAKTSPCSSMAEPKKLPLRAGGP